MKIFSVSLRIVLTTAFFVGAVLFAIEGEIGAAIVTFVMGAVNIASAIIIYNEID